jgi:excisionase family DNA binding protein
VTPTPRKLLALWFLVALLITPATPAVDADICWKHQRQQPARTRTATTTVKVILRSQELPDPDQLLTPREVAEILTCPVWMLRREVRRGRIGFVRVGRQIRFTHENVLDYLERAKRPPS